MNKLTFTISLLLIVLWSPAFAETITGPAEIKDEPEGKTILVLNDGLFVDCWDCSRSNADWYLITVRFQYMKFKSAREGNCPPSMIRGNKLLDSQDNVIGEAIETETLDYVSGNQDDHGYHCWGSLPGYVNKKNIIAGSIIEKNEEFYNALTNGDVATIKVLLSKGVRATTVNEHKQTHVILAARYGYNDLVKLFLTKGADVNAKDEYGYTALKYAASSGYRNIAETLLANGAKLEERDSDGNTALLASLGHRDVIEYLLAKGADINTKNKEGDTLLMKAARIMKSHVSKKNTDLPNEINLLLSKGAKIDMRNGKGEDAFIQAFESPEAMSILASHGADINTQNNKGQTALMLAANGNYLRSVEFLLEKRADLNKKDNFGRNALGYAKNCSHNCGSIVQILQKQGVVFGANDPYKQKFPCSKLIPSEVTSNVQIDGIPSQILLLQDPQLQGFLNQKGDCRAVLFANYYVHYLARYVEFKKNGASSFPDIVINFNVQSGKVPHVTYVWSGDRYEQEGLKESRDLNLSALDFFNKDSIQDAIAAWEQAYKLALMPYSGLTANAEVINNLAFAYHKLAKKKKSDDYYEKAEQLYKETQLVDYRRWEAYLNLGDLLATRGDVKNAVQNYEKLLEYNPDYKHAEHIRNKIATLRREVKKGALLSIMDSVEIGKGTSRFTFKLFGDENEHSLERIVIYREDTKKEVQTIEMSDSDIEIAEDPTGIEFEDINFDGYQDMKIRVFAGATGNEGFSYYLFNPRTNQFVYNKAFADLDRPKLIPEKKQFITYRNQGSAGAEYATNVYEVRNGKPVLIRRERQEYIFDKGYFLLTEEELVNDKMKTVRQIKNSKID